jgi:hypothetical protein
LLENPAAAYRFQAAHLASRDQHTLQDIVDGHTILPAISTILVIWLLDQLSQDLSITVCCRFIYLISGDRLQP